MPAGIYKITSPTNNIYIGQAVDLDSRLRKYRNLNCKSQRHIYSSLVKYGIENHKFEIISSGDFNRALLNELEIHYIHLYNSFNSVHGMNLKSGGNSIVLSDETREKIRKTKTGKPVTCSPEAQIRRKIICSLTHKGRVISQETREKVSKSKTGVPTPLNHRINVSIANKNRIRKKESYIKCSESLKGHYYPPMQLLNTETGIFYNSVREATLSQSQYSTTSIFSKVKGKVFNNTPFILCS